MHEKHKAKTDKLIEAEKAFRKIAKERPLVTAKKQFATYNLEQELLALNAECALVKAMYTENDFRAASYAYAFTMKKIEEMIRYIYANMGKKDVAEWCGASSSYCVEILADGSKKSYSHLGYLYEILQYEQMAIAARYFIEYNLHYLERDKQEPDYPSRKRILEAAVWWINQGLLGRFGLKMPFTPKEYDFVPQVVIFSTFPSSGKSYLVNTTNEMFTELNWIINSMGGFLRVGNEQGNIFRQSRQTMNLIENKRIFDIYPENKKLIFKGSYRPFGKSSEEEWGINGVEYDPSTSIFKTRDSAINSVRCKIASMDDPSRGQQEATNVKIHEQIVQLYRGDFSDRFKNQDDKFIILTGTMFNPNDVFAQEMESALRGSYADKRFRNTYISLDHKTIVIVNDCEDEKGESAYPEFISSAALAKKREGLNPYDYACVWRQKPIPADGLIFDYDFLKTYENLPNEHLSEASYAYIDPTRRSARDFFSMPILKYNTETDDFYLIDAIFEQKAPRDLYDRIIDKIIQHKIMKLVIESNVNEGLKDVLEMKLKERGIKWCEISVVYNTVNKSQRIADDANTVKTCVVFPRKGFYTTKHPVGLFMYHLTQYTTDGSNKHDDAPDSICGFVDKFVIQATRRNKIKTRKKFL